MTGAEAVALLPKKIRIGAHEFSIVLMANLRAEGSGHWGECCRTEHQIRVRADFPTKYMAVDTVMHEIFHAIYWAYNVEDEDKEERLAVAFGTSLMALHRDNPWLAGWLTKVLKD